MGEGRLQRAHELRRRAETHISSAGWLSARELLGEALGIYREESNAAGEVACLRGLGDVALTLKETDLAEGLLRQALEAAHASGDPAAIGDCLYRQGDLARSLGRHEEATARLNQALAFLSKAGHRKGEAECLGLLGEVASEAGDPRGEALGHYLAAHAIQMEVGDLRGAVVTLTFLANFLKEREPARAARTYVQAARVLEGLGLNHRADSFLKAAHKLDPQQPAPVPRRPGPWDTED